jgi:hypothetical protein
MAKPEKADEPVIVNEEGERADGGDSDEEPMVDDEEEGPVTVNPEARRVANNILNATDDLREPWEYREEEEKRRKAEDPYYWESEDVEKDATTALRVWHWSHWGANKGIEGAELLGEIFANFFGLTQSKYQWVLDAKEADEERARHKELCDRQRRELALKRLIEEEKKRLSKVALTETDGEQEV